MFKYSRSLGDCMEKESIEKRLLELKSAISNLESVIAEPRISSPHESSQLLAVYEWAENIDGKIQIGYNERARPPEPVYKPLSEWLRDFASKIESDAETIVRRVRDIKGITNQPDGLS